MTARVYRDDASPDCDTTHHAGCACHEARRDARERELTGALRALAPWLVIFDEHGAAQCAHCGAAYGFQRVDPIDVPHSASCDIGRALRVLDGGAT